jgi:pyruvate/2-oxoglutarate dehydrogenase complex dihydrolipoamide dehydrogenase (E3) component
MIQKLETDLCVIGAGSGGLSVAAAAAMMKVPVVLIERGRMGGDCLNAGCVPSKALIAAAKHAQAIRDASAFGITSGEPQVNGNRVKAHVQGVIDAIRPTDSVARFTALGAQVIEGEAQFTGPRTVRVGNTEVRARRIIVATGSRPAIPPIPGLESVPYLTNESLFDLAKRPQHLAVIGAGPIGIEMAQAHRRLGSEVTVIDMGPPLSREDREAADVVIRKMKAEGVTFITGVKVLAVAGQKEALSIRISAQDGKEQMISCSHILVATGRKPNVESLGLGAAGIVTEQQGIVVDRRLRTSNRRVYAIGDVTGPPQFTHRSGDHAGVVLRNALFRLPAKVRDERMPRVTFCDPEITAVGLSEDEALKRHKGVSILRWPFAENDRAQAEGHTEGFIKAIIDAKGYILGVVIVGRNAGELLAPWLMAIENKQKIGALAAIVFPYPTLSEISKRVAVRHALPQLRRPILQRILRFVRMFG